ncbi:MAG: ABC transporter substrate-binding protein [candidate division WOR-3 bacterium]
MDRYLLLILAFIFITGCGDRQKQPAAGRKIIVTFWHAMGGPLGDALEAMIQEFETQHPEIDIQPVSMANYSSLSQKLMGAVQVNAPPNLAQMYESWTSQFYALNKLVPADSLIHTADGLTPEELADFFPAFIENNTWNDRLVTLPFNKSIPVFFYNIEQLKQAGYEQFPQTWTELRTMLRHLTSRETGRYGSAGIVNEGVFGTLLLQQGGRFLNESTGMPEFNSRAGVYAARFLAALVNEDSSVYYGAGYEPQNDFLAGRIACIQSTSVSYAFLKPNLTFRLGIAPLPIEGRPAVIGYGTNIGIFRTGTLEQLAAAWRFVKWFVEPEQQAKWAVRTGYVPVRRSALAHPEYRKLMAELPGLELALKQLDYLAFEPKTEIWFAGRRILGDALEKIIRTGTDAQTVLDEAARQITGANRK